MTHKLRIHGSGETLVEIEASMDDLSAVVIIRVFGPMLGDIPIDLRQVFIDEMDALSGLRHEYWWTPGRPGKNPRTDLETPDELAARRCKAMAAKWGLTYVTD